MAIEDLNKTIEYVNTPSKNTETKESFEYVKKSFEQDLERQVLEFKERDNESILKIENSIDLLGSEIQNIKKDIKLNDKINHLNKKSNTLLSLAKKVFMGVGLSATLLTGYVGVDFNRQGKFSEKEKAKRELEEKGITDDQKISAYKPGLSELIYESVTPLGYQEFVDDFGFSPGFFKKLDSLGVSNINMIQSIIPNLLVGRENRSEISDSIKNEFDKDYIQKTEEFLKVNNISDKDSFFTNGSKELLNQYSNIKTNLTEKWQKISQNEAFTNFYYLENSKDYPHREDAWRVYLGLPQENNTFSVSNHKPSNGKDDKYYYKINNFWSDFQNQKIKEIDVFMETVSGEASSLEKYAKISNEMLSSNNLKGKIDFVKKFGGEKSKVHFWNTSSGENYQDHIMGNYTFGVGEDEKGSYVYYYDKWDLASKFAENSILNIGNSYEIYDRQYYNPLTFEVLGDKDKKE